MSQQEYKKKTSGKAMKITAAIFILYFSLLTSHFSLLFAAVPQSDQILIHRPAASEIEKIGEGTRAEPVQQPVAEKKTDAVTAAYQKSLRAYNTKKYDRAIRRFKDFIDRYPQHPLADNASYWLAECFYAKSDFAGAVFLFKKMIAEYPRGNKVPDALLKIGYSYLFLNKPRDAKPFLERVIREYPSQRVSLCAEKKLKQLSQ